jgi:hypothetical protein
MPCLTSITCKQANTGKITDIKEHYYVRWKKHVERMEDIRLGIELGAIETWKRQKC